MPRDVLISNYKYVWVGGSNNIYAFTTNDEIGYEIKFVPSAYLFKMDAHLPDGDRFTLLSGILSNKHPYFSQFVELFKSLAEADK